MTYETIIVQLDFLNPATPLLKFAWDLAHRFKADLIAFAAAEAHPIKPGGPGGLAAAETMAEHIREVEERLTLLKNEYDRVVRASSRASWRSAVGHPTQLLASNARAADLLVIGSPGTDQGNRYLGTVDPGSLLLSAGRPILVASKDLLPIKAEKVLVAWKDTREARRSIIDALPFLTAAEQVFVVTIDKEDNSAARASAQDVVRFLARHGVKARCDVIDVAKSDIAEALNEVAWEMRADLIVSGGYGHSRLRELVFGGVTRSLLRHGAVNRLMAN